MDDNASTDLDAKSSVQAYDCSEVCEVKKLGCSAQPIRETWRFSPRSANLGIDVS